MENLLEKSDIDGLFKDVTYFITGEVQTEVCKKKLILENLKCACEN